MKTRQPLGTKQSDPCRGMAGSPGERGFTLLESLVAVAVLGLIMVGLMGLFTMNNRLAKAQINVSEMQQALRGGQQEMVRIVRTAGRGGLPPYIDTGLPATSTKLPGGVAVGVNNNVAAATKLGGDANATVVAGTDVLTVRGVFNTPIYQMSPSDDGSIPGTFTSGNGQVTVRSKSPTGVPQDLEPLRELIDKNRPEALILVSAGSDEVWAVVEYTGGDDRGTEIDLRFTYNSGINTTSYQPLSSGGEFPSSLRAVASLGILEEYRYYVRDVEPAPRLSRARFYPGTQAAYAGSTQNLYVDVADNILDLQVALGVDRSPLVRDGVITDGATVAGGDPADDDWLFNSAGDDATLAAWNSDISPLYYVRLTTLARTGTLDPGYIAPPITAIEDHPYGETAAPADDAERISRAYRRRQIQTVVDMRNLS